MTTYGEELAILRQRWWNERKHGVTTTLIYLAVRIHLAIILNKFPTNNHDQALGIILFFNGSCNVLIQIFLAEQRIIISQWFKNHIDVMERERTSMETNDRLPYTLEIWYVYRNQWVSLIPTCSNCPIICHNILSLRIMIF